jgi:hypothetical protein
VILCTVAGDMASIHTVFPLAKLCGLVEANRAKGKMLEVLRPGGSLLEDLQSTAEVLKKKSISNTNTNTNDL